MIIQCDKQVDKIEESLKQFYGEDPSKSPDLSRVVNENHWGRLLGLLKDESTAEKVVYGGESDKTKL
jgi:aldehyde dehydrogenase (NAD+)